MSGLSKMIDLRLRRTLFIVSLGIAVTAFFGQHSAKAQGWNEKPIMVLPKGVRLSYGPIVPVPCDDCRVQFYDNSLDGDGHPIEPWDIPLRGTLKPGALVKVLAKHQEKRWNWCGPPKDLVCDRNGDTYGGNLVDTVNPGPYGDSGRTYYDWVYIVAVDSDGNPLKDENGKPLEDWVVSELVSAR